MEEIEQNNDQKFDAFTVSKVEKKKEATVKSSKGTEKKEKTPKKEKAPRKEIEKKEKKTKAEPKEKKAPRAKKEKKVEEETENDGSNDEEKTATKKKKSITTKAKEQRLALSKLAMEKLFQSAPTIRRFRKDVEKFQVPDEKFILSKAACLYINGDISREFTGVVNIAMTLMQYRGIKTLDPATANLAILFNDNNVDFTKMSSDDMNGIFAMISNKPAITVENAEQSTTTNAEEDKKEESNAAADTEKSETSSKKSKKSAKKSTNDDDDE